LKGSYEIHSVDKRKLMTFDEEIDRQNISDFSVKVKAIADSL
jgi:hypothetical protein